jgi:hypothetical protein
VKIALTFLLLSVALIAVPWAEARETAVPTCAILDFSFPETNSGTFTFHWNLECSNPTGVAESADYQTTDGTATSPDDYIGFGGQLPVPPGLSVLPIEIDIVGDGDAEPNETFAIRFEDPEGVVVFSQPQSTVTIEDDDGYYAPCILLSETAVSVSGAFSTASTRQFAGPLERIQVTNCGQEDVGLRARGTNATGAAGTWELTSASSGGSVDSTCDLGTDVYRANLSIWNEQGGSNEGAVLTTQDADVIGPTGRVALPAAAARELSVEVELPCQGSTGSGQPMTMDVVLTAVTP